ncbi:MAG: DUF6624 domain-containing protein [Polaribacter sp.]|uniref:DUF6624 domain-containing protein n=1 Tax=Polaribacter sp. TaxID=1920175 RepID=UPI002F35ADA9
MNKFCQIIILLFIIGCKNEPIKQVEFNQELKDELAKMAITDQIAAYIPQGKHKELTKEEWNAYKDSVFTTHQKRLSEIFNNHGFPGFDLVGKEGAKNFWMMTQHSDKKPEFQFKVLEKMKVEVSKKNAKARLFGLLTDRVNLNTGKKQIYGTQLDFDVTIGKGYPRNLADSVNVNKRRLEIGLEPLEVYLNKMNQMHFKMNKTHYDKIGIIKPYEYVVK